MLNTQALETNNVWTGLQDPARAGRLPADFLLLLSALDEGWTINEVVCLLARGRNDEGRSYILTLWHPRRLQISRVTVAQNARTDALLESEGFRAPAGSQ